MTTLTTQLSYVQKPQYSACPYSNRLWIHPLKHLRILQRRTLPQHQLNTTLGYMIQNSHKAKHKDKRRSAKLPMNQLYQMQRKPLPVLVGRLGLQPRIQDEQFCRKARLLLSVVNLCNQNIVENVFRAWLIV